MEKKQQKNLERFGGFKKEKKKRGGGGGGGGGGGNSTMYVHYPFLRKLNGGPSYKTMG